MSPYMGCSRPHGIPRIDGTPLNLPQTTSSENSEAIVPCHAADDASRPQNSGSSQCSLPGEPLKRRRSRRGQIRECYARAIAAFSTVYPKVFSGQGGICPLVKIKPGSPTEDTELPALISTPKQGDCELPVLPSKFPDDYDSPSFPQAEVPARCESPGFDPRTEDSCVVPDECGVVESLLDSSNSPSGLDAILGGAGDSNPVPGGPPSPSRLLGDYGNRVPLADEGTYYWAIRALGRRQDCCRGDDTASGPVGPWSVRLADKIKAQKEMNAMSFCSLDWLKRDAHHGLALKLNYQEILSAWSDRGSLYIDEHCPQTVPGDDEDDDVASVDVGLVPDLNFWRVEDENVMQYNYTAEDGCSSASAVENGVKTGIREARVLRYKEKRQSRLFSKKIRYQVRKINAERRPRMKGRFVKRLANL